MLTPDQVRLCWIMLARWLKDNGHMVAEWGERITAIQHAPNNIPFDSFSREDVVLLAKADGQQDLYLLRGEGNSACRLELATTMRTERRFVLEMASMVFACHDGVKWMDHHDPPQYDPITIARRLREICVEHFPELEEKYRNAFRDFSQYIAKNPKEEWYTLRNHDGSYNHWEGAFHRCDLAIMLIDVLMTHATGSKDWAVE